MSTQTTKIETPTETNPTQNKTKGTLKNYIILPIALNGVLFLLGAIGLFGKGVTAGIAGIVFNLPIFIAAIDWKDKDIKWYFRIYYLLVSLAMFFLAFQSILK